MRNTDFLSQLPLTCHLINLRGWDSSSEGLQIVFLPAPFPYLIYSGVVMREYLKFTLTCVF